MFPRQFLSDPHITQKTLKCVCFNKNQCLQHKGACSWRETQLWISYEVFSDSCTHVGRPWFFCLVWEDCCLIWSRFQYLILKAGNVWHILLRCSLESCFNARTNRKEGSGSVIIRARHLKYHISYLFIQTLRVLDVFAEPRCRCLFNTLQCLSPHQLSA